MKVTNVRFDFVSPQKRGLCARVSLTFDKCFVVHDVCIVDGKGGLCVTYPNRGSKEDENGKKKYIDVAHPIDNSFSKKVTDEVLSKYKKLVEKIG